ncbi:MAG: FkbM family methyltransferase [Candidatus Acidiferrales bacterium]
MTKKLSMLPDWPLICHPHVYETLRQSQVDDPDQSGELLNFVQHCHRGMLLFDLGASFGVFSLAAAHFGGKAIAVDPSPIATRLIKIEAALNACEQHIEIVQAGVSEAIGAIEMLDAGVFSNGYFRVVPANSRKDARKTPVTTIDEITARFGAPSHIKVDVEGHEAAVLRGAKHTLSRFSPLLFIELHNEMVLADGDDPNRLLDDLAELGYELFEVTGLKIGRSAALQKPIVRVMAKRPILKRESVQVSS